MEKLRFEQAFWIVSQQNLLNESVDPNWRQANYACCRALIVEAVEALEFYDWKWWAKTETDYFQMQLELVDVLCFAISFYIKQHPGELRAIAESLALESNPDLQVCRYQRKSVKLVDCDIPRLLDIVIGYATMRCIRLPLLERLFLLSGLISWEEIILRYRQKYALHVYRQVNGYRVGRYNKFWPLVEDSNYLQGVVTGCCSISTQEKLIKGLEHLYRASHKWSQ
ncbi:UNVERIFIED_ORG: hypothetical protein J2X80_001319 [Pseudomonas fluorescens]|uniref:dUTP diphosphatase n=1 Tax=Pseudomonas TaxID=286 RepID=UPI0013028E18|nr:MULTISPECIES: dUTP diphosphatase [unclassified Pseudomonas]MDP9709246.1 hypothetical protein [Pseudomonas fluorescens]QZD73899.1 dUTP diphosphatase [Pseudomonas sp. 3-2]